MEADNIARTIKKFILDEIAQDVDASKLENGGSLLDSGIIDSFGIMSLLTFIGDELGVAIPPEEIEPANFETLDAISALVVKHQ